MATFPTGIKTFTNPNSGDHMNILSHAQQHAEANAEITAIQTALGANLVNVATADPAFGAPASINVDTEYQAATALIVTAHIQVRTGNTGGLKGLIGAASPASTYVASSIITSGSDESVSITFVVPKDYYYQVTKYGTADTPVAYKIALT